LLKAFAAMSSASSSVRGRRASFARARRTSREQYPAHSRCASASSPARTPSSHCVTEPAGFLEVISGKSTFPARRPQARGFREGFSGRAASNLTCGRVRRSRLLLRGPTMRIAYISCDDVNRFLFRMWVRRIQLPWTCEVAIHPGAPIGPADGFVLDLDFMPARLRAAWVAHAANGCAARVLAHGHNISDDEAQVLRRAGVLVFQGLLYRRALTLWLRDL